MTPARDQITLTSWSAVREAFRTKALRQAGYGEGAVVTADTLLDLHGDAHRERRRVENRLFRRDVFHRWERELLAPTVAATLGPFVEAGRGDLAQIGYRSALSLTATIAGIDINPHDGPATDRLFSIVKTFSEGATLMHSTRDKDDVRAEVHDAMAVFRRSWFDPAFARRSALVMKSRDGHLPTAELPADVLTTLVLHNDRLGLESEVIFREICLYLQAGAHSTANAFTHTVDDLLSWGERHRDDLAKARSDIGFVQRCMHESLRLHPASPMAYRTPVEDLTLAGGTELRAGSLVVLDLVAANRDPLAFGPTASDFDPHRHVANDIPRWGLSFGAGAHACIGAELDGGLPIAADGPSAEHLFGTVAVMAHAFLKADGDRDPANPPVLDPGSTRKHFSSYPVLFPK